MTRGRPGASFGGIVLKSSPPESLTVFRHCRDRTGLRIAGVTVRAGDLVLLDNGAANHNQTVFIDPERFEVTLPPVAHLSFGHDARYCLGAPLVRIEQQAVFSRLVPSFPAMRLAEPVERLTFNRDTLTSGLTRLPVTW